ncbi:MAG: hypothetical protein AB7Q23_05040 [Hyphomonadaceae bacterium]
MKRILFIACAAALVACGQGQGGAGGGQQTAQVSTTPCAPSTNYDGLEAIPEIYTELLSPGDETEPPVGISVTAPAGSTCTGPVANGLTCQVSGPRFTLTIQDTAVYEIPEGRTATLTHNAQGITSCFLNAE